MRSIFDNANYETHVPKNVKEQVEKYLDEKNKFILDNGIKASIFMYGGVGVGKTRAAHAIKNYLDTKLGAWFTQVHNFTNLVNRVRIAPSRDSEINLDEVSGFKGLLIIDDLGARSPHDVVIDNMYMILNYRYEHMLPTIITSNLSLDEIEKTFGNRIASRIDRMAVVVKMEN